jgi:alginate O-acetyltransferase complex protein AlgJ
MKTKVLTFISMAVLMLIAVPIKNLTSDVPQDRSRWSQSTLYNFDFALPITNQIFYPLGISLNPSQSIIGKRDWLYMGDLYESSVSSRRRGMTDRDKDAIQKTALAMKLWKRWLHRQNVSVFKVMLGPDKETIYPEFLPDWAKPATSTTTDALLAEIGNEIYVDPRSALITAKTNIAEPLYYKTDSHWNRIGAWVAFRTLITELSQTEKGLWLTDRDLSTRVFPGKGGDLARFLHLEASLPDREAIVEPTRQVVEIEQYDYETGKLIASGGNPTIDAPQRPLLVKSKHGLNRKKVLWLRDSFGTAMAPLMAATFTETLQIHYDKAPPQLFGQLVEAYKPDYVFMTVVERGSHNKFFVENLPPPSILRTRSQFKAMTASQLSMTHDITQQGGASTITGNDPYISFVLNRSVPSPTASQLAFDLDCGGKTAPVKIQLFWQKAGATYFDERNSTQFVTAPGTTVLDLSQILQWNDAKQLVALRMDIDSPTSCPIFTLGTPELGTWHKGSKLGSK